MRKLKLFEYALGLLTLAYPPTSRPASERSPSSAARNSPW